MDNRKGGGCCWNVTTIDKKHGHQLPYLNTHTLKHTYTHTHTYTFFTSTPIAPKREKTYSNAQDKTVSQFLQVRFYMKKFTVTHIMREIFFLGTAKAIRCVSQQQQNNDEKIKHFTHFVNPQGGPRWTECLQWTRGGNILYLQAPRDPSERSHSQQRREESMGVCIKR